MLYINVTLCSLVPLLGDIPCFLLNFYFYVLVSTPITTRHGITYV